MTGPEAMAVAAGGAIGAVARWAVALALPAAVWPWPTLVVNVVGAGVLGWLAMRGPSPTAAAFWRVGVLGSFTTFSALAVEVHALLGDRPAVGVAYLAVTLTAGVGAARLGLRRGGVR